MSPSSQPDNVFLSLLVTAVIMANLGVIYLLFRYRAQIKQKLAGVEAILGTPTGVTVFTWARVLVGLVGAVVLFVTFLPGLVPPLQPYLNQNLGLGGIVFIFIWPIILVQIIAAFIPYSRKLIARQPFAAWVVLAVVGYMAISLDIAALGVMYEFNKP